MRSGCARVRSGPSTTSASSAPDPPASPQRCTPPARGSRPWSSSATHPAGRPGRARPSRTTSASPRGCPGRTSPTGRWRRRARFGAEMVLARDVVGFETRGPVRAVLLDGSADIEARAVLVASGVSYRRLERTRARRGRRARLYYGASASEAVQTAGEDVYVVGAANSAGQAALNFARYASAGRARRARRLPRGIDVAVPRRPDPGRAQRSRCGCRPRSSAPAATGTSRRSRCATAPRGRVEEVETGWVFVFIGAAPRTDWLGDVVARDDRGFVLTGPDLPGRRRLAAGARPLRAGDERARRVRRRRRTP